MISHEISFLRYICGISDTSNTARLGICRDRRDRRSCKIFVSCVNFSRKQRSFSHILQVHTHLNVNFLHNNLHILFNFNQKRAKLLIMMHFRCLLLAKIVSIYAFSVLKIFTHEKWVM